MTRGPDDEAAMAGIGRRAMLRGAIASGGVAALAGWMPGWAKSVSAGTTAPLPVIGGEDITLRIARQTMTIDGRRHEAIGINGTVPAPLIRLREGQTVRLRVINDLDEESSIHWHGLLVPARFDGVPGVSFPGIPPRGAFVYEFPIRQSGTYWYHSHSGLQEQLGHYGPIVIDPAGDDPVRCDREHVVMLSDHCRIPPEAVFHRLKADPGGFNYQRQTLSGLLAGRDQRLEDRLRWGGMRMDPADISDVTGSIYTCLVNGHGPADNWTALFTPGERVRLRIINASSMTTFNLRIPGLRLTVVQADGQNVVPVTVDEFQIGVAETYDVIVTPVEDRAFTLVAEAIDRSGMARATLAPRPGMVAQVPPLRHRPLAGMRDMGMDMGGGPMPGMAPQVSTPPPATGRDKPAGAPMPMDHAGMAGMADMPAKDDGAANMHSMRMRDFANAPQVRRGPGVQMLSPMPVDRTGEPGQGLEDVGHRVLVYRDLIALDRNPDVRAPSRSLDFHLTGNMERYMWSFDGQKMSDAHMPVPFVAGERVRVNLVNDTMMGHPIHIHGHFFELVTGHGDRAPRKHTVLVQPGGKVTWDFTADAVGDWAFHCHLLYHMYVGMMRVFSIRPPGDGA